MEPLPMDRIGIDGLNGPFSSGSRGSRRGNKFHTKTKAYSSNKSSNHSSSDHSNSNLDETSMNNSSSNHGLTSSRDRPHRRPHRHGGGGAKEQAALGAGLPNYKLDRVFGGDTALARNPSQAQVQAGSIALLKEQGFSTGLAIALNVNSRIFDRRIWIIDNSGSMDIADGHRIVMTSDRKTVAQSVSRWEELQDTVIYHSEMAALMNSPTLFKLLNHPGPGFTKQDFSIATPGSNCDDDIRKARTFMHRIKPIGTTPLTKHVWSIQKSIHAMAPKLRAEGRRVVVVLATDGLPTDADGYIGDHVDAEFLSALKALEGLPVWLVIRLCTDEEKVTKFYNELDGKLDLSLEVLDDFLGEAEEVLRHNKWLNYCLPLHRCRELGYHNRIFDFLDERPLTRDELRQFCSVLFASQLENIPDPTVQWKEFIQYVHDSVGFEDEQYDPLRKKKGPWIYTKTLQKLYGKGKCSIM